MVSSSPLPKTVAGHVVLRTVEFCRRRGYNADQLCSDAGLHLEFLRAPDARVPWPAVEKLGMRALELTGDENFGLHLAQDVGESANYDAGVLVLMASPTLGASLQKFAEHLRYWGDGERVAFSKTSAGLTIRSTLPGKGEAFARHCHECAMAEIALGSRVLTAQPIRPVLVRFEHRAPRNLSEHQRLFDCPLEFGARSTEILFDPQTLQTKMPNANEAFLEIFEQQINNALCRLPPVASTSDAVRLTAKAALAGGHCSLGATAQTLGMSVRTLQRRLHEEGTSFNGVIDALRQELAQAYVARDIPNAQAAFLLGYADETSFLHALRRWTGATCD